MFDIKNKDFNKEIKLLFEKLKNKESFAFSKYADGEYAILKNKKITNCDNWTFDPEIHNKTYQLLLESFQYNDRGYYVGISCPCCVPEIDVNWMRENVGVPQKNLTWANIFVNNNYKFYKENFIPEYSNHDIILFVNKKAKIENLPFNIEQDMRITNQALIDDLYLVNDFPVEEYNNKLFLFCAGPLGNILTHKFWKRNKSNIYLDIGSTLNNYLIGANRGYLRGAPTLNKKCIW